MRAFVFAQSQRLSEAPPSNLGSLEPPVRHSAAKDVAQLVRKAHLAFGRISPAKFTEPSGPWFGTLVGAFGIYERFKSLGTWDIGDGWSHLAPGD